MGKLFWFDVETTGLDPVKNDIVELSYIIEIDGSIKEKETLHFRPITDNIDMKALEVNGLTLEEILDFRPAADSKQLLVSIMEKYVNKFNKLDKFIPAGYFNKFDQDFLRQTFIKLGDKFYGSWFHPIGLEVSTFVAWEVYSGLVLPNYKLKTCAEYYKVIIDAHKSISDIEATRELYYRIKDGA